VHRRIVLGVAAWLIGAGAATGGSLLAVNMLGQGMTPGGGEQQSVTTVNRALAKEAAARAAILPRRAGARHAHSRRRAAAPPAARAATSPQEAGQAVVPGLPGSPSAPPPSPGATTGTVLTSEGGTLVASCAGARAYLVSWSPQQGFWSTGVVRGPAASARAAFTSGQLTVTMAVSCATGVPAAATTAVGTGASAVSPFGSDGD
jgi:hypothetical protein